MLLAAPDSFKGTYSALEVANAMSAGAAVAGWSASVCPVADGGEGTMEVLLAAIGGRIERVRVTGPLGHPVMAGFALLNDGVTAVVETAQASGLTLVGPRERDAEAASTIGTGELIIAARKAGAARILVTAGGSATTDGGLGAVEAIQANGGLPGTHVKVLCDVETPYEQAAIVFGPQKGADWAAVNRLTKRLGDIAELLPRDPRGQPWTGCAGGLSGALWAMYGAELVPGARAVLDVIGFDARLNGANVVITGEGRIDAQSLRGKITGEVIKRCAALGTPVHAMVGQNRLPKHHLGGAMLASITETPTLKAIEEATVELLIGLRPRR